jgi:hypothetical protein
MAEIPFETFRVALEAARGTAEAAPTHLINLAGKITPNITRYRPKEARGTRARNYRSVDTRKGAEWEAEGDADGNETLVLLNMSVAPLTTPSTPSGATLSRLWSFVPNLTADNIKSATAWWGDPALNQLLSDFCVLDELVFENDASGEEVLTISAKGMGGFPSKVSAPSATASIAGVTFPGQMMQCWIDTASAIGTTAISGRLISAKHTIRTGATYKYLAAGPTGALDYTLIGRDVVVGMTTELKLEFIDYAQYDLWSAGTGLKCRVRHNGALIESTAGPVNWYNYVEFDTYGPAEELDWDDNEGSNRALNLTINSTYDVTLGADFRVAVQNQRTTL